MTPAATRARGQVPPRGQEPRGPAARPLPWRAIRARDLAVGVVLDRKTGPVRVMSAGRTHGGVELVVIPASAKPDTRNRRVLWFWPGERVDVLPEAGGAPLGGDLRAGGPTP